MFYIVAALTGLAAGNFLIYYPLIGTVTAGCVIFAKYLKKDEAEMGKLLCIIFIECATIGNVIMWITHYIVTKQCWIGNIFDYFALLQ